MKRLVIVLGPTGVGKTAWSISKARECGSPVISCDSRQIYKEMSIGTAVPSAEELAAVKHYFIQTESVTRLYSAGDYEADALELIGRLFAEGHDTLVMTGGSMLYIDAVCKGFDALPKTDPSVRESLKSRLHEEGAAALAEELRRVDPDTYVTIDTSNGQRVIRALEVFCSTGRPMSAFKTGAGKQRDFAIEKIGLCRPRETLYARINRRVLQMVSEGLVEEVRSLLPYRHLTALQTVGYKEIFAHLDGRCTLEEAVSLVQQHSRNYAKRQLTWWRRDPSIRWTELNG